MLSLLEALQGNIANIDKDILGLSIKVLTLKKKFLYFMPYILNIKNRTELSHYLEDVLKSSLLPNIYSCNILEKNIIV